MSNPILSIENLYKNYGATEVLKDINVSIQQGEFLVLVGPSGCGKSTLLNCIAGLEDVNAGAINIGGRNMVGVAPKDRDIAMVFQSYALYPTMTVGKNITFGMKVRGVDAATQAKKLEDVAKLLQIEPLLNRKPGQLSGGQRQRVAMGRALVRDPQLFLFDEPLSNLDAKLRVEMRTEIKRLHSNLKASIVYVTHDQIEAMTLATRIVVMKDGYVQQIGTPAEIYNHPANMFVADFMGSPSMNLIPATVEALPTGLAIKIKQENGTVELMDDTKIIGLEVGAKRELLIGLRPENITNPTADSRLVAPCRIEVVEPAGSDTFATTSLGGKPITARLRADTVVSPGAEIDLSFDLAFASYFDAKSGERLN